MKLAAKAGKIKKEYKLSMMSDRTMEKVRELAEAPIEAVFTDPTYGKVHAVYFCRRSLILGSYSAQISCFDFCIFVYYRSV